MAREDLKRFEDLTYEDFRRMADDDSLSRHEKVGFPDSYREGKEEAIFADITAKLSPLGTPEQTVLDIGPGCSALPHMLIDVCRGARSDLILVDSKEMLAQLPDEAFIFKLPGHFPDEVSLDDYNARVDVILVYSVLHYVFAEGGLWPFLDRVLSLLASGGAMLLGDIPNLSKRRRFFTSEAGIAFHREFMGDDSLPDLGSAEDEAKIDDAVVLELVQRARDRGYDAYVVPQRPDLPMANRREDILIVRP
jgi:cyclopropane fatty-acyl-phospholipid synthase-like methyltransferase